MIFLLPILFFSQFNCVFSDEKHIENANLFNEFINVVLDMCPGPSEHEAGRKILNVANAAEMLEMVEKNVAKQILASSNVTREQIHEVKNSNKLNILILNFRILQKFLRNSKSFTIMKKWKTLNEKLMRNSQPKRTKCNSSYCFFPFPLGWLIQLEVRSWKNIIPIKFQWIHLYLQVFNWRISFQ